MRLKESAVFLFSLAYSWLNALLVIGALLTFSSSFNLNSLLGLLISLGISFPVKTIYENIDDLNTKFQEFLKENLGRVLVSVVAFIATASAFVYGFSFPGSNLLNLSFHTSSQAFFPVKNSYSGLAGEKLAGLVFNYGRFYLHFIWIYLLSGLLIDGIEKLSGENSEDVNAKILPFTGSGNETDVRIELYVVTGIHGFLKIPESFCKECNMFYQAAQSAAEETDKEVDIPVKSYWTRFLRPLLKGGTHPPVMLVNGELFAQGYDVPKKEEIVEFIEGKGT